MKRYLCFLLLSCSVNASTLWLEHAIGEPWQKANIASPPLALQHWILTQDNDDWPLQLEQQLLQHYCVEDLATLPDFATRSHFLASKGQVLLTQQMQRQLAEPQAMQPEPWQRLTPQQAKSLAPVYLLTDRQHGRVQSVMLGKDGVPTTLWQFEFMPPQSIADSYTPFVLSVADTPSRQPVIVLPARNPFGVQMLDPSTGDLLPFASTRETEPLHATAMPAVLDTDMNGALDRIYQITEQGQLYRLQILPNLTVKMLHVANLKHTGWQFTSAITATRSRWPLAKGWQMGDVLVIQAHADHRQQTMVVKIPEESKTLITYDDLTEQHFDAPAVNNDSGWRLELIGRAVAQPSIMAGVLYLPMALHAERCGGPEKMDSLLAVHLYSGNAIYEQSMVHLPTASPVKLSISKQEDGLSLMADRLKVVAKMRGVRGDCLGCSEALLANDFPKWQKVASYHAEQGAY